MKTVIVNIPDKKEKYFLSLIKKNRLRSWVLDDEEDEVLMAKWIDEGMKSGEIPIEKVLEHLRKHGVNC